MNEITKKKISKKLTGRPKSATTKYRIKKSLQNRKLSDTHKKNISETAKSILDARAFYPNSSLADLYDPLTMPAELRRAHTANDKAVMAAYGFSTKMTEADCVGELMKLYQKMQ